MQMAENLLSYEKYSVLLISFPFMRRHDIVNLLGLANWRGLDITECIIGNGLNGGIRYDEESLVDVITTHMYCCTQNGIKEYLLIQEYNGYDPQDIANRHNPLLSWKAGEIPG